jgi:DNA (cytosine-5)-methyltransferase 1
MRHGSLFSGIGGFDLAAQWMGWENVFHCEWNEFGQKVLKHHFPKSISYADITKVDFRHHRGDIDIISGGFPCQPYSSAGKRLGKEDDRHLWPEMLRCIREVSPRWVVGENVLGLVNWSGGLVFHEVQANLEAEGYEVQPYVLPAASVNAPHRRDRVWFVAYRNAPDSDINGGTQCREGSKGKRKAGNSQEQEERGQHSKRTTESHGLLRNAPDSDSERSQWRGKCGELGEERQRRNELLGELGNLKNRWKKFPTKPPICGGDDGLPRELDGITFPKWRNESIKAYGNAIVPQVALQIFKAIAQYEAR